MASAWGKSFGAAFGSAWGIISEAVQPLPVIKRRSGLGSLKIHHKTLPQHNPDLEEIFEPEITPQAKQIRARTRRDEFLILH